MGVPAFAGRAYARIWDVEIFPAVAGRVTAWAGRAHARFRVPPRLRDTLSRATAVAGHVTAWAGRAHARFRVDFELFEVRGLGRGGISEAA